MDKIFNSRVYLTLSFTALGIGAFLLGGLAVYSVYDGGAVGGDVVLEPLEPENPAMAGDRVYASRSGKRYYPWWCDAGQRSIKAANIIWYDTVRQAEAAGYTLAKSCE